MHDEIEHIEGFWTRQYALYYLEHRHALNRATHMIGIPLIMWTPPLALYLHSWSLFLGGQIVGWFFQLLGHRIEGNKPAFLDNPWSLIMGPFMVGAEILDLVGLRLPFIAAARRALDV